MSSPETRASFKTADANHAMNQKKIVMVHVKYALPFVISRHSGPKGVNLYSERKSSVSS